MALARYVVTANVTLAAGAFTLDATSGERRGTGSYAAPTAGNYGPGAFLPKGSVVYADSSVGTTGPQLLYVAIGAANLRAYVQGQDDVGREGISN
jgi:hypothetical protein